MSSKHSGRCSFCEEKVRPEVIEKNFFRRDKCLCPSCKEIIYTCRSPLCHDYAKGGEYYDDELCRWCIEGGSELLKGGASIAITALVMKKLSK